MKTIAFKKFKLDNRGFTLTEISLAFLIGTIVILICTTLLFSSSNYFQKMEAASRDKLFADNMLDTIKEELAYATNIEFLANGSAQTPNYANVLKIINGRLYLNNKDIYETLYTNQKVELQVSPQKNSVITLTVTIKNIDNAPTYTTTQTFTVNTMAALNTSFSGITSGTLTDSIISYKKSGT